MNFVVEPGVFNIMIAKDAANTLLEKKIKTE
jgi:hypothetical protein